MNNINTSRTGSFTVPNIGDSVYFIKQDGDEFNIHEGLVVSL